MLETLDYTLRIGSTPTFLFFDVTICLDASAKHTAQLGADSAYLSKTH